MTRVAAALVVLWVALGCARAQQSAPPPQQVKPPPAEEVYEEPPEEDRPVSAQRVYAFNPLQAEKELRVGVFYSRKGSHKAAALRFEEATRWNPQYAEAFLRLGEAREKLKEYEKAREAYGKYLEIETDEKRKSEVKSRLARLAKK